MRARALILCLLLVGCGAREEPVASQEAAAREPAAPALTTDTRPAIVAFGDSLSAGYGVAEGKSYPAYLQQKLDEGGYGYRVVNAGISGDTTSGGVERVGSVVGMRPFMVILELGGNDGLRGLPIETTRANLEEMIVKLKQAGVVVVLAGMTLPPNYGPDYIGQFERVYRDLAEKYDLPLVPFLLEGAAGNKELMQGDGIHPTADGNRIVARNVMRVIGPLLKR